MQRDAVGVSGHRRVLAAAAQLEYLTPAVVAGQPDQGEIAGQVVGLGQIQAVRPCASVTPWITPLPSGVLRMD